MAEKFGIGFCELDCSAEGKEEMREELQRKHQKLKNERDLALEAARVGKVERQREVRDQLQKQVEEVRVRKEKEVIAAAEDRNRIQIEAERMEEALQKRESEDRERLEEFYAKLEREASQRERRAEWKLRRGDPGLDSKRRDLYQQMEQARVKEMEKFLKSNEDEQVRSAGAELNEDSNLNPAVTTDQSGSKGTVYQIITLPGVPSYALSFFALKLVNYSFFFWLPYFLHNQYRWSDSTGNHDVSKLFSHTKY